MDNDSLTRAFIDSAIAGKILFLANADLRIEPAGTVLQLWAKHEGMIASTNLGANLLSITIKDSSRHTALLQQTLLEAQLLPAQPDLSQGFFQYELANVPRGYQISHANGLLFLQAWWHYQQQQEQVNLLGILLWFGKTWHPIRSIECDQGMMQVFTWGNQITLAPADQVVWLLKDQREVPPYHSPQALPSAHATHIQTLAEDTISTQLPETPSKYIGNYLVEAGLLSTAQVDVVLCDQTSTSMRFGEIVASRGWLKEQTIEYLMKYLISPRQRINPAIAQTVIQGDRNIEKLPAPLPPVTERKKEPNPSHLVHDRETLIISRPFDEELF